MSVQAYLFSVFHDGETDLTYMPESSVEEETLDRTWQHIRNICRHMESSEINECYIHLENSNYNRQFHNNTCWVQWILILEMCPF